LKNIKWIRETFLALTQRTYPHGHEDELVAEMSDAGIFPNLEKDPWGNYFYKIGESRTIFASHFDTVSKSVTPIKHITTQDGMVKTDGTTILGADDKAGVTIMLWMIKNEIPGLYYFFIGEEVGCIGSGRASAYGQFSGKYDRIISFDRRGTNSVITFQSSYRSCSDEFAESLAKELNKTNKLKYRKDDTGVYTDSAEFVDVIPECTNISVGYYSEHTTIEKQDIIHLSKLSEACVLVDWENLPTKRVAGKSESKWSNYYHSPNSYYDDYPTRNKRPRRSGPHGFSDVSDISSREWDEYFGWNEDGDYDGNWNKKKTRRSGKKGNKPNRKRGDVYIDSGGGNLIKLDDVNITKLNKGIYRPHIDNFLSTDITKEELEEVKKYISSPQFNDLRNDFNDVYSVYNG
jgi:hypothetical protein